MAEEGAHANRTAPPLPWMLGSDSSPKREDQVIKSIKKTSSKAALYPFLSDENSHFGNGLGLVVSDFMSNMYSALSGMCEESILAA